MIVVFYLLLAVLGLVVAYYLIRTAVESAIVRASRTVDKERREYPQRTTPRPE